MTSIERAGLAREATDILLEQLAISPVRNSSLVDASFTTPSPGLSSKLANLWAQQFLQASIDRRFAATSDARKYLEGRLNTLRQNLETRSEEHTSELQSLMRISYAVFCLKKKTKITNLYNTHNIQK